MDSTGADAFQPVEAGFEYDPISDKFVGLSRYNIVYVLDPVTKTWTVNNPPGAPTGTPYGPFGRWRYVPALNAFVVVTGIGENVHFYKLTPGLGTPYLTYSALAFQENVLTNGAINNNPSMQITLSRDQFTGVTNEDFVADGKLVVSNLPAGLTAVATRVADDRLLVSLEGTAVVATAAASVTNLTFNFQDTAITGTNAAAVTDSQRNDLQILFYDADLRYDVSSLSRSHR